MRLPLGRGGEGKDGEDLGSGDGGREDERFLLPEGDHRQPNGLDGGTEFILETADEAPFGGFVRVEGVRHESDGTG